MRSSTALPMALIVLLGVGIACRESRPKSNSYSITYEVTSTDTDGASLTYSNDNGSTEQQNVGVPWIKRFTAKPGQFLYLSAQNRNDFGSLTVRINVDGKTVKTATSNGSSAIASASLYCCQP